MKNSSAITVKKYHHHVAVLLLLGAALPTALNGQTIPPSATFTTWDLLSPAVANPVALIVDRTGAPDTASPAGTVWYGTQDALVRFIPGTPLSSGAASWTRWSLAGAASTTGLKVTTDDVVFVRARLGIERIDPKKSTDNRTRWFDGSSSLSDLALDSSNNVWTTTGGGIVQRLTPALGANARLTRWDIGGGAGAGSVTLSGIVVDPATGLVYYAEPFNNTIGELNPAATTNNLRRWDLSALGGYQVRQLSLSGGKIAATTGLDQVIQFDPSTNQLTICTPPTPASDPYGVVATNGLVGFTENLALKIGCWLPAAGAVTLAPSVSTVAALTTTLAGITLTELPTSGAATPATSTQTTAPTLTPCGTFVEAWIPNGCCYLLGIDSDPSGPPGTFYYAAYAGSDKASIGRVVLPIPK